MDSMSFFERFPLIIMDLSWSRDLIFYFLFMKNEIKIARNIETYMEIPPAIKATSSLLYPLSGGGQ